MSKTARIVVEYTTDEPEEVADLAIEVAKGKDPRDIIRSHIESVLGLKLFLKYASVSIDGRLDAKSFESFNG